MVLMLVKYLVSNVQEWMTTWKRFESIYHSSKYTILNYIKIIVLTDFFFSFRLRPSADLLNRSTTLVKTTAGIHFHTYGTREIFHGHNVQGVWPTYMPSSSRRCQGGSVSVRRLRGPLKSQRSGS